MNNHPSMLALDELVLGRDDASLAQHVEACERCAQHIAAMRVELPIPNWVSEAPAPRRWPAWLTFAGPALALATAALIAVVVLPTHPTVQAKGMPTVEAWINRDGQAALWGGIPVHAGDALRFRVAPAGFSWLTVVALDGDGAHVLHAAALGEGSPSLTPAWKVDDKGPSERVAVVLSQGPLSEAQLHDALSGSASGTWVHTWVFPKEVSP